MYRPLAAAVVAALAASLLLALTLVPVAAALLLAPPRRRQHEDVWIDAKAESALCAGARRAPCATPGSCASATLAITIPAIALALRGRLRLHAAAR